MVERVTGELSTSDLGDLADVLIDCIADGASVGWPGMPSGSEIDAWWRGTLADPLVETWVSRSNQGRILGTVSLQLIDTANARHRAEVLKLLVHRDGRGRGVAKDLIADRKKLRIYSGSERKIKGLALEAVGEVVSTEHLIFR